MIGRLACLLAATLALGACSGDDDETVDPCAAVEEWYTAVSVASNDFSRAGHDVDEPARRRELYLEAFAEMIDLTSELTDQVGDVAELRGALDFAVEVFEVERAEAVALPEVAYATRAVRGGSLFTASERARATVSSASRAICSPRDG